MKGRVCAQPMLRYAACLAVVLAVTAMAQADVNVDGDGNVQNETSLTLVPSQSGKLVMAYNDAPYTGPLGIGYTADSGATWNTTQLSLSVPDPYQPPGTRMLMSRAFDPTITADAGGCVYAGFIADASPYSTGPAPDSGLYVSKSSNAGQTWGAPVQVSYDGTAAGDPDPLYRYNDRCQITADRVTGSSYLGNIYIAWIKDRGYHSPTPQSDIYFSRSTDSGATFSAPMTINDTVNNDMGNMPIPAVAANGNVYVSWMDYNCQTGGIGNVYILKSTDGGVTFPQWDAANPDHLVTTINLPPLRVTRADGTLDALAKGAPVLAASPSSSSELYLVYAADPDGAGSDEADIFLIKSTDSGQNWGSPVKVNHDDTTINDNIEPWISVKPDGTIDVAWYDRRNDPNDILWDVYIAKSIDGGATFSANVCLTDNSFATPTVSGGWMGEYLGLTADATNAYVAFTSSFTDSTNGDVYFDKIPNSNVPEPVTMFLLCGAAVPILLKRRR